MKEGQYSDQTAAAQKIDAFLKQVAAERQRIQRLQSSGGRPDGQDGQRDPNGQPDQQPDSPGFMGSPGFVPDAYGGPAPVDPHTTVNRAPYTQIVPPDVDSHAINNHYRGGPDYNAQGHPPTAEAVMRQRGLSENAEGDWIGQPQQTDIDDANKRYNGNLIPIEINATQKRIKFKGTDGRIYAGTPEEMWVLNGSQWDHVELDEIINMQPAATISQSSQPPAAPPPQRPPAQQPGYPQGGGNRPDGYTYDASQGGLGDHNTTITRAPDPATQPPNTSDNSGAPTRPHAAPVSGNALADMDSVSPSNGAPLRGSRLGGSALDALGASEGGEHLSSASGASMAAEHLAPTTPPTEQRILSSGNFRSVAGEIFDMARLLDTGEDSMTPSDRNDLIDAYTHFEEVLIALRENPTTPRALEIMREWGIGEEELQAGNIEAPDLFANQLINDINTERQGIPISVGGIHQAIEDLQREIDDLPSATSSEDPGRQDLQSRLEGLKSFERRLTLRRNEDFAEAVVGIKRLQDAGGYYPLSSVATAAIVDFARRGDVPALEHELQTIRENLHGGFIRFEGTSAPKIPSAAEVIQAFQQLDPDNAPYPIRWNGNGFEFVPENEKRPPVNNQEEQQIRGRILDIVQDRVPALVGEGLRAFAADRTYFTSDDTTLEEDVRRQRNADLERLRTEVVGQFARAVEGREDLEGLRALFEARSDPGRFAEVARQVLHIEGDINDSSRQTLEAISSMLLNADSAEERVIMQAYLYRFLHLVDGYRKGHGAQELVPIPQLAFQAFAITSEDFEDYIQTDYNPPLADENRKEIENMRQYILKLNDQISREVVKLLGEFDQRLRASSRGRSSKASAYLTS